MSEIIRKPISYWTGGEDHDIYNPNVLEDRLGELSESVLKVVDHGLCSGIGYPRPGDMCVEAAVCYAMGLPHKDTPPCVDREIRNLKVRLNDFNWASNASRANGMRRIAIAQLGTKGKINGVEFNSKVHDRTVLQNLLRFLESAKLDTDYMKARTKKQDQELVELIEELKSSPMKDLVHKMRRIHNLFGPERTCVVWGDLLYYLGLISDGYRDQYVPSSEYAAELMNVVSVAVVGRANPEKHLQKDKIKFEFIEQVIDVLREMNAPAIKYMDELAPLPK